MQKSIVVGGLNRYIYTLHLSNLVYLLEVPCMAPRVLSFASARLVLAPFLVVTPKALINPTNKVVEKKPTENTTLQLSCRPSLCYNFAIVESVKAQLM